MPAWTTADERFIIDNAGLLTVREIADELGRSYSSVVSRVHLLRERGLIDRSMRVYGEDHYISDLVLCVSCNTRRSTCDKDQVCKVCRDKILLENHKELMYRAYDNLPRELQEKTNGTFNIYRSRSLMKTRLQKPKRPNTTGMNLFDTMKAEDDYFYELEAYELRLLKLDIDAVKQRRSKWKRKAAKYRAEKEGRY